MWLFGLILALGCVVFAIALVVTIVRAVIEAAIRLTLAAILAAAIGCVVGLVTMGLGGEGLVFGVLAAVLAYVPALIFVWRWRVENRAGAGREMPALANVDAVPIEQTLALQDAATLAAAWDDAQQLAPRDTLDSEREACARFLVSFEADADCDPARIELAIFIRRHVPGLVSETRLVAIGAFEGERREAIIAMVAGLQQLGRDARAALADRHQVAQTRLAIRQQRFAIRSAERGETGWQ